ncbi:hypothetical protein L1987_83979 [Smallanthus sonchifolius]|uniref:Uncharacterized protein n=1 Tax=Smallanthus sonchifolius TaxID=185202 RepID=A0ACB8YDG7_9ASTR|nr:hypothetical protein L1987_83979 [Smallanthus sonchifolius]
MAKGSGPWQRPGAWALGFPAKATTVIGVSGEVNRLSVRAKNFSYVKDKFQRPNMSSKRVPVDILIADEHEDAATMVIGICWTRIPHAKTSQEAELLNAMIVPLQEAGCEINELRVPTESTDYGHHFDLKNSYIYAEIVVLIEMVKGMFGGNKELKQEILRYLMWASEQTGCLGGMGRYVSGILAWNEMNMIVSNRLLVSSKSPVLDHVSVQDEVANFTKAWSHIEKSPCPMYFRYFCTEAEEKLIQRRNFPTLCAELVKMNLNRVVTDSAAIKFLFGEGDYDELSD